MAPPVYKIARSPAVSGPALAAPLVRDVLRAPWGALKPETSGLVEGRPGHDFGAIRIHSDERADAPLPMGSFSPAPGITVDYTEKLVRITGTLEAYGPEASAANAAAAEATIRRWWNQTFPDGYKVRCDVTVTYRAPGDPSSGGAQIEMARTIAPSHVNEITMGMTLNMNEHDALTWVVAHEFGHQLGLRDRYSESIISKLAGTFGFKRTTTIEPGYEGNLMAVVNGAIGSSNVRDIQEENSPGSFTEDDYIQQWVSRRSAAQVSDLPTATKIQMLETLLQGWVSQEDLAAIEVICKSVTGAPESAQIKQLLEGRLLDLSHGPRARVRWIMGQMP